MSFDEADDGANYLLGLKQSGSPQAASSAPVQVASTNRASVERRKSPRYSCQGSARVQQIGSAVATWATFIDISMHGCYIETAAPLAVGAVVALRLEANDVRFEATGEVRVVYPGLGMGISLAEISVENRERLRELMRSISQDSTRMPPSKMRPRAAPHPNLPATPNSVTPHALPLHSSTPHALRGEANARAALE